MTVSSLNKVSDSHNQDIGFYLNNIIIDNANKYKLFKCPCILSNNFEFPISKN